MWFVYQNLLNVGVVVVLVVESKEIGGMRNAIVKLSHTLF